MAKWSPKNQPAFKVVSSGSVSKPIVPSWSPKNEPAWPQVKATEPIVTG